MSIISIPVSSGERTAGGTAKEIGSERIYSPKKQGICPRSVRDPVQQEGLRRSREVLVAELHSAQRTHSTRSRRTVQSRPLSAGDGSLREPAHHRRRRLRHSAWPLYGAGTARRLDRS